MKNTSKFRAFNFALGDNDCETEIHRSEHSPSSSLLPMEDLHKQIFPFTAGETIERIKIRRLDVIARDLNCNDNILVKFDVQGYEDKVILGGRKLVSKAKVLIVETSFQSLYKEQPLFDTIYNMLKQMGFSYMGNLDQIENPVDGSILQADSVFVRGTK